mmetsp:Transcript_7802/g.13284  ORF Transcript_7802/g.13284 Transcript_7802/m.13284 type:complete len:211 (-) Transcript_7802:766-1398(-)
MTVQRNSTSIGSKITFRVLSSDTALDSNATRFDILLLETNFLKGSTTCNTDLSLNNINSSNFFGNSVLDLNTRIDLNKVRPVLAIDQEFNSSCILVLGCACQLNRIIVKLGSQIIRQTPSGCHLNNLLMSPLNRAITFPEMDNITLTITDDLHLNMPWLLNKSLNKNTSISETSQCFTRGTLIKGNQIFAVANNTHTFSSTTHGSLDDNR